MVTARPKVAGSDRRLQLASVATELFARQGYDGTTMDDVANAAGVTKPIVYQHFTSKRALYDELIADTTAELVAAIAQATSNASGPRAQVLDGFTAVFSFVAYRRESFLFLYRHDARSTDATPDPLTKVEDILIEVIDPLIAAGLEPGHRRVLAAAVVSMAEGVARRWLIARDGVDAQLLAAEGTALARQVADLAWGGLRSVEPGEG